MIDLRYGKSCSFALAVTILLLALSSGCSKQDTGRVAVSGNVTWKGNPVPSGVVFFNPNASKGNKGPQGFALIKDGHYDTRDAKSKGCVTGAVVVSIQGCDGQGIGSGTPYGHSLFAPYEMPLDIPAEGGEVNLKVPDTVAPAAPPSEKD